MALTFAGCWHGQLCGPAVIRASSSRENPKQSRHRTLRRSPLKSYTIELIHQQGSFAQSKAWGSIQADLHAAAAAVKWPPGGHDFAINPTRKKNGVREINNAFRRALLALDHGWDTEWLPEGDDLPPEMGGVGSFDVAVPVGKKHFVVEWETGNISSSHRSLNRITLGILSGFVQGGVIILPTKPLYPYLTDRIGNYDELRPYFPVWGRLALPDSLLGVMAVEHDRLDPSSPLIPQGRDGNAK